MVARNGGYRRVLIHEFNTTDPHAWVEWKDLSTPLDEYPWLPPDAGYVGGTLQVLSSLMGASVAERFHVLVSWYWSVDPVLPHAGDDVLVLCLGDELGRMPPYAHDVRLVAKTGGATRRPYVALGPPSTWTGIVPTVLQETRAQLLRLPSVARSAARTVARGRRPTLVEIPPAPWSLSDEFVPFVERLIDISFAGSLVNEGQEHRRILPQKTRSRRRMLAALEALERSRPDVRMAVKVFNAFNDAKHAEGYAEELMQTRLAVCPRGGFRETYRLFEAAASGCVPITERLPRREYYRGCPAVQLRSWSRLPEVVEKLLMDGEALSRRSEAALRWWSESCSPRATAARIFDRLGLPRTTPVLQ